FPAWYHGVPVVGHRAKKFEPQAAMQLMADHGVRNVFLPPTALKLMRQVGVRNAGVNLRSMLTGGESLGAELLDWVRATFGIDAHEVYGQTECNLDRKSTRLNSSHGSNSYAVFCIKKKEDTRIR